MEKQFEATYSVRGLVCLLSYRINGGATWVVGLGSGSVNFE